MDRIETPGFCAGCQREIKPGEVYSHQGRVFCEDCYMDIRMPRSRKTHWQYLHAIKTEYLIPEKTCKS